ncbi:unnamed protein product, partial [Symbiodinium pilosum]
VKASETTVSANMETLETKLMDALRKSEASEDAIREVRSMVEDVLQRVEATEAASKAVREELMSEDAHSEAWALARTCQDDLRGVHSDVADLQASLRSVVRRVEDAAQEGPGNNKRLVSDSARRLELRVDELQKQVVEELEQLAEQQQLIARVKPSSGAKPDVQDLEHSVERLAAQVAQELQELKTHQGELGKVRVRLQSADASKGGAPEVESKVLELQQKVLEELHALGKQQEELGRAKVTMADLSDRVQQVASTVTQCKEVTVGLEERLKKLSSMEETTCPECGNIYLADAKFCRGCGHRRGNVAGEAAKTHGTDGTVQKAPAESGQSDVEDSYGADDFEESVDEASMSEDKAGGDK